jgi:hypothetical protein
MKWLDNIVERIINKKIEEIKNRVATEVALHKEELFAKAKAEVEKYIKAAKEKAEAEIKAQLQEHVTKLKNSLTDKVREAIKKELK